MHRRAKDDVITEAETGVMRLQSGNAGSHQKPEGVRKVSSPRGSGGREPCQHLDLSPVKPTLDI